MGSKGVERRKQATPGQTPEGNVVMSFSFESYQLEEEDCQVKDISDKGVLALSEPAFEEPIPDDRYHRIYFAMLLFITDVDYLHHKFEGTSIVFDMGLTYILVALVAVILNNVLVEMLSLHTRITVGYLFALGPLLFVTIFDVWLERFTTKQSYVINLMSMGTVAFGCTVQQSSFYGYMGMLPKRYTQGVMTGESTAGVIISLSRIFTKLLIKNERKNTIIFFTISICMVLLCFILHIVVRKTRFVQYYTGLVRQGLSHAKDHSHNGSQYQVHHDVITEEVRFGNGAVGSSPTEDGCTDFAGGNTYVRFDVPKPKIKQSWPGIKGVISFTILNNIHIFPGLESEIRNVTLGEWLPILIMAIFNISDFVGKILAAVPYEWNGTRLLFCSCVRVVFIPLFIMCVYPAQKPTFSHPAWPCIFSLLMGVTNGYFGSVPMIHAAGKVAPEQRELAGNIMTVSYMSGLMLGSVVAYAACSFTASGSSLHSETGYNFTQGY
uniref:Solute carrier family 29 member 4 n=1 Tax=Sinocyclocheilus anshuiensis TaxID=1608454 RepID=A0A671RV76_9TELE